MIGLVILSGLFLFLLLFYLLYATRQIDIDIENRQNYVNRILNRYK